MYLRICKSVSCIENPIFEWLVLVEQFQCIHFNLQKLRHTKCFHRLDAAGSAVVMQARLTCGVGHCRPHEPLIMLVALFIAFLPIDEIYD